jgi:Kef-type K+ transport system membrane component KefB
MGQALLVAIGSPGASVLAAAVSRSHLRSLVFVLFASMMGAVLARLYHRLVLPTVVVEIVLGMVIGPSVLDLADVNAYVTVFSDFGLGFLFFVAGIEVIQTRVSRGLMQAGTAGWLMCLALSLVTGWALEQAGLDARWWLLGVALSTTALGMLVPILSDAELLPTQLGSAILGVGMAGEFWPVVFISIFLTGAYGAWEEVLLLLLFGVVVLLAAIAVLSARPPAVVRILQETVYTSGQAAVRASLFVLALLVLLAAHAGFDFVLGAFAAGLVVGLALDSPEGRTVRLRLEGIGFGLLIPIYFVQTGMSFDLDALITPSGLGLSAGFLVLLVLLHLPALALWRGRLDARELAGLALCSATGLPLVVAIVGIGVERGGISTGVGASLIAAGMISVLLFPWLTATIVGPPEQPVAS